MPPEAGSSASTRASWGFLEKTEAAGRLETALKAISEVYGILELLGKLDGQLEDRKPAVQRIVVRYVDKQSSCQRLHVSWPVRRGQAKQSQAKDLAASIDEPGGFGVSAVCSSG
jgi:hypothetical protein